MKFECVEIMGMQWWWWWLGGRDYMKAFRMLLAVCCISQGIFMGTEAQSNPSNPFLTGLQTLKELNNYRGMQSKCF